MPSQPEGTEAAREAGCDAADAPKAEMLRKEGLLPREGRGLAAVPLSAALHEDEYGGGSLRIRRERAAWLLPLRPWGRGLPGARMPEGTACAGAFFYSSGLREGGGAASTGAYCPGGNSLDLLFALEGTASDGPEAGSVPHRGGDADAGGFRYARGGGAQSGDCGCRGERRCSLPGRTAVLCGAAFGFLFRMRD